MLNRFLCYDGKRSKFSIHTGVRGLAITASIKKELVIVGVVLFFVCLFLGGGSLI